MKLPVYSLRIGILSYLTFLIVSAMLLISVVMLKFAERDLIEVKVRSGQLLIHALKLNLGHLIGLQKNELADLVSGSQYKKNITKLLDEGQFSGVVIVDHKGNPVLTAGTSIESKDPGASLARKAMETRMGSINYSGSTWGVIWLAHKEFRISEPLLSEGRSLGGITLSASLAPIYQALRRSEKLILLYIILDTILLTLVGIYLLSRIVVKPIHNLLNMTEEYKEGEIPLLFDETSRNEIAKLSRSLSNMLKRLDENKKELKDHISSLEGANRELQQAQNEILRSEKLADNPVDPCYFRLDSIQEILSFPLGYISFPEQVQITKDYSYRVPDFVGYTRCQTAHTASGVASANSAFTPSISLVPSKIASEKAMPRQTAKGWATSVMQTLNPLRCSL